MKNYKLIRLKDRKELRAWFKKNHKQSESVWMVIVKKSAPNPNFTTADLTEEALCFGWIDSVPGKIDDKKFKVLVSPRRVKSVWSRINKERIENLIARKLMTSAGLKKIKAAKANGSWDALNSSDRLEVPVDLKRALATNKKALKFYDALTPGSKKAILEWIGSAKTERTRSKRIAETVHLAAQGRRANRFRD